MDTARYVRLVLAVGGNVFVVLSALFSLAVYTSGDPSGLQYLFLVPAIGLAGLALAMGLLLALLSLRRPLAWMNPALAAFGLLVAMLLPQATSLGDVLGAVLAAALLPLAVITTVAVVRGLGPLAA